MEDKRLNNNNVIQHVTNNNCKKTEKEINKYYNTIPYIKVFQFLRYLCIGLIFSQLKFLKERHKFEFTRTMFQKYIIHRSHAKTMIGQTNLLLSPFIFNFNNIF